MTPPPAEMLLPCPFCENVPDGNDPRWFTQEIQPKWGAVVCCITGPEVRTGYEKWPAWRDAAIEAWNDRPSPPPAPELMRLAEAWVARVTAILAHGASGTAHEAKAAFAAALGRPAQGDEAMVERVVSTAANRLVKDLLYVDEKTGNWCVFEHQYPYGVFYAAIRAALAVTRGE